eukprot:12476232-Heterocapsa_arctica.AAC.1
MANHSCGRTPKTEPRVLGPIPGILMRWNKVDWAPVAMQLVPSTRPKKNPKVRITTSRKKNNH